MVNAGIIFKTKELILKYNVKDILDLFEIEEFLLEVVDRFCIDKSSRKEFKRRHSGLIS